ncbi:MAG TPA: four helix bundle protein [Puia sp.]|nr:four helix bundle protein [Puia sp.]
MSKYQELDAWKVSMQLVKEVYLLTQKYPKEELYGLTAQTRRSAVSIPSNIAEGIGRQYKKDNLQFQHIARGSLYELQTLLEIAKMVGLLDEKNYEEVIQMLNKDAQLLNGWINYLENSNLK